jgi:hypothetical protein
MSRSPLPLSDLVWSCVFKMSNTSLIGEAFGSTTGFILLMLMMLFGFAALSWRFV